MAYGWEGELIRLVPVDADKHLENAVAWLNDPEVTKWVLIGDLPISRFAERNYLEEMSKGSETDISFAIETLEGVHIGFTGVHQINRKNGTAITGTIIGDQSYWGKGIGTDVVRTRARFIFEVLGLRMILTSCLDGNTASHRMSLKNGFVEYGRTPKRYWKRGQYRDEILLCLDIDRWRELQNVP